ncbi:hypothetical protein OEG84_11470 [Hoeflea sp. G2-23]|uniref:Uncharacterized protein n=1 Tax=Hoeflea algicola TaxID=2983763 RepID=A0ABT3Z947_9HYPH|nr:hypothetical protein [Hoeflea algicola]MCY0148312.1 hypothetical protein [Hoeflea algicola]
MSSLGYTVHTLATAVADDGTVAIAYPTGATQASLAGSAGGDLTVNDGAFGSYEQDGSGFSASFGASNITITNLSGVTWPAGAVINVSFGDTPRLGSYNLTIGGDAGQASEGKLISQELTASGAVNPGTQLVELNHASTIIEATYTVIPNTTLIIKDTSATGTAAHKITVSGGTLNGSATVATFNLRDEMLVVAFDSAGRGQVIANVGSVVLS